MIQWPPDYSLRKSQRARSILLKITPQKGLEVVVPSRYKSHDVDKLIGDKRKWIEKNLQTVFHSRAQKERTELPKQINLLALNQVWHISYIPAKNKPKIVERPHQQLVILGDISQKEACKKILIKWLHKLAKHYLLNWLQQISQETQLSFKHAIIRGQTSRWGSCSAQKTISLNFKLLFLPYHLVRHTIIHELCHTIHLNHSEKFWRLVARFDPAWKELRGAHRNTQQFLPLWVE